MSENALEVITRICPRSELFSESDQVISGWMGHSDTILQYSNSNTNCSPAFVRTLIGDYLASEILFPAVSLGQYPRGTLLIGGGSFYTLTSQALAAEQISPLERDPLAHANRLLTEIKPIEDVRGEYVLAARFGAGTWGHWLGEILPRAALAEHFFPGRFRYVVPVELTGSHTNKVYAQMVQQSLEAFGIGEERLFKALPDRHYRFESLFDMPGVEVIDMPSPAVLEIMRNRLLHVFAPATNGPEKVALLRRPTDSRPIYNQDEIVSLLQSRGFACVDSAVLSFREQAVLALSASEVFGTWGSSLIWLMFAQPGVRVLSVAPANWEDGYFRGLLKVQKAVFADVRGLALWNGQGLRRDAPFYVSPTALEQGLTALDRSRDDLTSDGTIRLADHQVVASLGPVRHSLEFARGGNAASVLRTGWANQEDRYTWSMGTLSEIALPRAWLTDSTTLEMFVATMLAAPFLTSRPLKIEFDGLIVADLELGASARVLCRFPKLTSDGPEVVIRFHHPICPSPSQLGFNGDERPLAWCFHRIRLRANDSDPSRLSLPVDIAAPPDSSHQGRTPPLIPDC